MARKLETPTWGKTMKTRSRRNDESRRRAGAKSDGKKVGGKKKTWWELWHPDSSGVVRRIRVPDPTRGRAFWTLPLKERILITNKSGKLEKGDKTTPTFPGVG